MGENIIDNLMLRYDGGILTQDPSSLQRGNLCTDEIEETELRSKADALAQRTILENYELREMVNDLRDENQHLRHEIYDLQDKINRQVLQINKLEKNQTQMAQQNAQLQSHDMATGPDTMMNGGYSYEQKHDHDMYADAPEDNYEDGQTNMSNHGRGNSITGQDWMTDEESTDLRVHKRRESITMEHPAETEDEKEAQDMSTRSAAQRTLIENFELKETIQELQDEQHKIASENYELQDKMNRQVLQISKLEKRNQTLDGIEKKLYQPKLECQNKVTKIKIKAKPFGLNALFRMCSTASVPDDVQKLVISYDIGFLVLLLLFWFQSP